MRCALYARCSTPDQDPEVQLRALRDYVRVQGWDIVKEYVDRGISGIKARRPALDQLMQEARQRKFQAVLVWRFDRFARSLKHLIQAMEEFRSRKIAFISLTEGIDTTTPSGELIFHIAGAMAQFERHLIQERVKAGLSNARAKGVRLGRPKLQVDATAINAMRREGLSLGQIARKLSCSRSTIWRLLHYSPLVSSVTESPTQSFGTPLAS